MAVRNGPAPLVVAIAVTLLVSAFLVPALAPLSERSPAIDRASTTEHRIDDANEGRSIARALAQVDRTAPAVVLDDDVDQRAKALERTVECSIRSLCESSAALPSVGIVLGYSRYDRSDPLENDLRADLYANIADSPGIYVSELSEDAAVHRSTVRYHVRILGEEGLISQERVRGKHRLYPTESTHRRLIAALAEESSATVLRAVKRLEPVGVSALADDLDRAPSTVSYHLGRLAEDGLVEQQRDGNTVLTRLPEPVRDVLRTADVGASPVGSATSSGTNG